MIRLTPPTTARYVASTWGAPRKYRGGWHEGLDFPDVEGSPVRAAAPGVAVLVDNHDSSFAGRWIALHHGNGIHTVYMHNKVNRIETGQKVSRGQHIADVGHTGTKSASPHVHFGTRMLEPSFSEYARRYGEPTTGLGRMFKHGRGVPSETFMDGARYRPKAATDALKRGVVFYQPSRILPAVLILGAAYLAYRHWR